MHNRLKNYDDVLDLFNNHNLLVVPNRMGSGFEVLNDWNLDRKAQFDTIEKAVKYARRYAARSSSFDGIVVRYDPHDPDESE